MSDESVILLVEDDRDHISIYSTLFTRAGYSLLVADSGAAAFELVQLRRPDIIICDIRLGRRNTGLDLVHVLRADPATASIPILVHSAYTDLHESELRGVGVPHMMKGADPHQLLHAVEALLARARQASPGPASAEGAVHRPARAPLRSERDARTLDGLSPEG